MAEAFWQLDHLSDQQVLEGLAALQQNGRKLTAELVAHLGEVEERRLHLAAACGSMFQYCVTRLGLSEDEACRRIDVARLARRFRALFPALASGELSLSVAALLKPYLCDGNQEELLRAVAGKSVQQARECIAARLPRPDVASSTRKVAERAAPVAQELPPSGSLDGGVHAARSAAARAGSAAGLASPSTRPQPAMAEPVAAGSAASALGSRQRQPAGRIEPLSAERYRVQFTAGAALKKKLELARDLMRHSNPSGDFAPVLERALDLLLEQLMKRRFGVTRQPQRERSTQSPRVSNATRRAVAERDGVQCSWCDDQGRRCESRAWLEHDHRKPRGKGGSSEANNIRLLCRAHNGLAAELEYGRAHMERAKRRPEQPATPEPLIVRDNVHPRWQRTKSLVPRRPAPPRIGVPGRSRARARIIGGPGLRRPVPHGASGRWAARAGRQRLAASPDYSRDGPYQSTVLTGVGWAARIAVRHGLPS